MESSRNVQVGVGQAHFMRDSPHLTNTLLNINEVSVRAVHVGWALVCGSTNRCSWAYRLATSHLPDMQLSMNDVSVGRFAWGGSRVWFIQIWAAASHTFTKHGPWLIVVLAAAKQMGYIHRNIQEGVSHEL